MKGFALGSVGNMLGWAMLGGHLVGTAESTEDAPLPGLTTIETVCVDDNAVGPATFQKGVEK